MNNLKSFIVSVFFLSLSIVGTAHAESIIAEQEGGTEVEISSKMYGSGTAVSHFYKANGTKESPTIPGTGQLLGGIGSRPWVGAGWSEHSTAAIHWIAGENMGMNTQGTWINFLTTPIGSSWQGRQINLQISPSGYLYYKVGTAQAYKSAAPQPLSNATYSAVSFDSEDWDNRSMHDGTSSTKLYAQQTGKYQVSGTVAFQANPNGARLINFRVNGNQTDRYGYQSTASIGASLSTIISSSTTIDMNQGDYVELYAYQNSGTDISIINESGQSGIARFTMQYVGN